MSRLACLLLLSITAGSAYAQDACKPEYKLTHSACKDTGKVLDVKTTTLNDYTAVPGACDVPDIMALGRDGVSKIMRDFPGIAATDITIKSCHPVALSGKFCGDFPNVKSKLDVRCDYEVRIPVKETVADASCPVVDVVEASGCYKKDEIVVDPAELKKCLGSKPKTSEDWWYKVACLSDLNQAAQSITPVKGLSAADAVEIDRQFNLALNKYTTDPDLEALHNYLVVRQRDFLK